MFDVYIRGHYITVKPSPFEVNEYFVWNPEGKQWVSLSVGDSILVKKQVGLSK